MVKIFVYGTLMKGERASGMLSDGIYKGEYILNDYAMYDLGCFPGIKEKIGSKVIGELYEVPEATIPRLDAYEGEGELYKRTLVTVENKESKVENVYAYVYLGSMSRKCYKVITLRENKCSILE